MSKAPKPPLPERIVRGQGAAPGLVQGVTYRLPARPWQEKADKTRSPATELAQFDRLVTELGAAAPEGQVPLSPLSDPAFLTVVREAIAGGEPAGPAFGDALDIRCAEASAAPEGFAALRRQVLARLGGLAPESPELPAAAIVLAQQLTPTRFLEIDWQKARGLVLGEGSARDHVALLARARGIPLLIGLGDRLSAIAEGVPAILDGAAGRLILQPEPDTSRRYRPRIAAWTAERQEAVQVIARPARTGDGTPVAVLINVEDLASIESVMPVCCDGIGLVRSEFLLPESAVRDEEQQYRLYRALLFWAEGRPVTIRTLDAGGDKSVPGLTDCPDPRVRGLALTLLRPEVFCIQLRALARSASHGELRILLPFVTELEQFTAARRLLEQQVAALKAQGRSAVRPPLGMMVETLPALRDLATFDADFFAIGSNDLERSLRDAEPDGDTKAQLLDLVAKACRVACGKGIEVSLCGELASRPELLPALLKTGLRALSVPPAAVPAVKKAIAGCRLEPAD